MKGGIYQKKENKKYYPYIYDKDTKKKKWGQGFAKKSDAEKELRKILNDYDNGSIMFTKSNSFKFCYEKWVDLILPEQYKSKQSASTGKGYINNHVLPKLGKLQMDKITVLDIQTLFKDAKKKDSEPLSPATKRKILGIMNSIFIASINWGICVANPCKSVTLKTVTTDSMSVWSIEQLAYFLDIAKDNKYYLAFLILSTTGMRRGEVCALKWSSYYDGALHLSHSMDLTGNLTEMKTKASHRTVLLMDECRTVINEQKEKQRAIHGIIKNKSKLGKLESIDSYICTDENNDRILPERLTTNFHRLITRNNDRCEYQLPVIRLHDLRHGFATLALSSGENIKVVSEILGHAKTSTTQNIYQHATETMQRATVDRLSNVMFVKKKAESVEKSVENL